ncbi:ABC transporter domain-containing protein [Sarocladium implicatum]|nr:ABC transporter domain-containing protein [Sarocladium implicatum]
MALLSQTWTLMKKNWRWLLLRHLVLCIWMALVLPLFLSAFFAFSRNLFVPPATYGFGDALPVRTLADALDGASGRDKIILVNNGYTGGDIERVLDRFVDQVDEANAGVEVVRVENEDDIYSECRSSLRGTTSCFCAVVMRASPDEGEGSIWNYTIRTDAEFAVSPRRINVEKDSNPPQIYMLPVQRTIDSIIASLDGTAESGVLDNTRELQFTDRTQEEREQRIREIYHRAIINFMGVLFLSTVLWITYHMTGFIAVERESGMSQLIDAMMPVRQQWMALAARIVSHHLSFVAIYAPAWIIGSIIVKYGVYSETNLAIILIFTLIGGIAMASMSIMYASFFKRAQLSGITAVLATGLLGIVAQSLTDPSTGTVAVLSVLFAPCAFVYFLCTISHFEEQRRAGNLVEYPPNSSWEIPAIAFMVFLVIQIFVYPLIGALIESNSYGTSTKGRQVIVHDTSSMGDNAVQLQDFSKTYMPNLFSRLWPFGPKPEPVHAVRGLTFNAGRGQIIALLGANGSGKSTTLDAIAGLNKLNGGGITIDGTGGLGIAPQKNVLWDDLTVEEHLVIFNRLKAPEGQRATTQEIHELIDAIDLSHKRKALSKTLSGGQKRKLQLGMMLTGGSAVCCVDEVSSGVDPLSRRKIWDILLAERGRRTIILTTHFLDEADLLADHIAIMSKGTLRAEGSSVELKDRMGGGYRVHVPKHAGLPAQMPHIEGVRKKNSLDLISYIAPSSSLAAQVIKTLEAQNIQDYRFSGPTIEDVFLQLAEEIKDEETLQGANRSTNEKPIDDDDDSSTNPNREGLKLMDGQRVGYVKQAVIMFQKRITILKRNWIPYALAFLLPVVAAGLTSLFIQGQNAPGCSPGDQLSRSETQDAFTQAEDDGDDVIFLAGPSSRFSQEAVAQLFAPIFAGGRGGSSDGNTALSSIEIVDSYNAFTTFIENNRRNVTTGLWLGDSNDAPTFAYVANTFVTSGITAQQFLDVIRTNISIATTWSPFEVPFNPSTGDSLNLIVYMGLAIALYPAFFALYPSNERRRFVRALQYSNGVRPFPLWVSYLLFDFCFVAVSAALVVIIWVAMSSIWYHIGYVYLILILYGITSTLMGYVVSLFAKTQLATYAWAAAIQAVGFLAYLIAYMCVNTYVTASEIDDVLLIVHFVISAFFPIGSVMRALFLALNLFSVSCDNTELSTTPSGILYYGGPILYLVLQAVVLFALLLWLDSGSAGTTIRGLFSRSKAPERTEETDEEVAKELTQVSSNGTSDEGLRVRHLTKSFGSYTAVDNVSFGIKRGEVFALLGPNGAGKSTTISLIRGDIKPSNNGGDVFVEDASVVNQLTAARRNLGVCPQVDALDTMTVREQLEFYAKVRGIPDVQHNVTSIIQAVGLQAFTRRMGHALSGGNKRKLSLGIALMGNPTVILLDEPSSGLDAASKRIMWKTLADLVPGRSMLLTTHSMEEADALAGRAGIMARRMLALGTPDNLRERFGDALHIHLVSKTAPRTSDQEMQDIVDWVRTNFPSAEVEDNTYHGQMRFSVSAADVMRARKTTDSDEITKHGGGGANDTEALGRSAIGNLAVILEENKNMLGVEHYSVSPTTLDQIFLTIVGQHNVQEENSGATSETPLWKKILYLKF